MPCLKKPSARPKRAAGQVKTMSTYDPDSDQLHEECGMFLVSGRPIATWLD